MSSNHWSIEVQEMSKIVLSFYEDVAPDVYHLHQVGHRRLEQEQNRIDALINQRWKELESKRNV